MASVLLCSEATFDSELGDTLVWREEIARHLARSVDEALTQARATRPELVLVDRDVPQACRLVEELRRDMRTRRNSIVVVARTDFEAVEVDLLEAGANAILRLPATPEWDDRLARLIAVPVRREVRFPVQFELEARTEVGVHAAVAQALNISSSGILIETDFELHVGDDIDLRFYLAELDQAVVGCGRVVRHAGRRRYGVEFWGLEGEGAETVARFIERLEKPA
jgi:CheY-like chemotaxis protein